jgi:NAD(P)-dependent dehydrogenase (short-subunit alcohol dehydrogenase family)
MNVQGKKIVITGAAGGLGSAMVRGLADAGADIYVLDIDERNGQALVDAVCAGPAGHNRASFLRCDLNDLAGTEEVVSGLAHEVDGIDVLVNNASIYPSKPFEDYAIEEYEKVQRVNLEAGVVCVKAVLPGMKKAEKGRIINVASITFYGGWANLFPYVVSKGGVIGMTRALARELGPKGITVNTISPGAFPTAAEEIHPDPESYRQFVLDHQSIKRRGTPDDIASLIRFLASDASSFITGQTINIDGGWVMN